jgi:hypothetical protein
MELWLLAHLVADGPKVFQPTVDQCLAMEQVAPRIAVSDYVQPYPVMVIDLPEAYQRQRTFQANPRCASEFPTHAPSFVLIGSPPVPAIWTILVFDDGVFFRHAIMSIHDATIEDSFLRKFGGDTYFAPGELTPEDRVVIPGALRLAVNAMLFLTEFGCTHLGAVNEPHYQRLRRLLRTSQRRGRGVQEARRNLRLAPQLYGFAQAIVLHDEERQTDPDPIEPAHSIPRRPHWRRGHWKMHAHGPGRNLRRRLFIKPVLVNRHLMDDEGRWPTTYRTPAQ